jgi:CRISPR-associated protein Cas4
MDSGEWIKSEEVRQWIYCPKIYYYKIFGGRSKQQTMKMMLGNMIHDKHTLHELWKEIALEGEIQLNKYITTEKDKLKAQIDMIYTYPEQEKEKMIIEIKTGHVYDKISNHHLAQVQFQAYVYEKATNNSVKEVGLFYIKKKKLMKKDYTELDRKNVERMIDEMKEMIELQLMPEVPYNAKCDTCEQNRRCWG